jgi:putative transposase
MSLIFIAVAINIGLNGLKRSQKIKCYYQVKAAHRASGGSVGARTIAGIVTTKCVLLSRYKATNIMKQLGLVSCQVKKYRYKKAENEHLNIPNTLN